MAKLSSDDLLAQFKEMTDLVATVSGKKTIESLNSHWLPAKVAD